jgi:hypothetical protein
LLSVLAMLRARLSLPACLLAVSISSRASAQSPPTEAPAQPAPASDTQPAQVAPPAPPPAPPGAPFYPPGYVAPAAAGAPAPAPATQPQAAAPPAGYGYGYPAAYGYPAHAYAPPPWAYQPDGWGPDPVDSERGDSRTRKPKTSLPRRNPGMFAVGGALTAIGAITSTLGIGLVVAVSTNDDSGDNSEDLPGPIALAVGGTACLGVGIPLMVIGGKRVSPQDAETAARTEVRVGAGSLGLRSRF